MKMKKSYLLLLLLLMTQLASAQKLKVESMKAVPNDISASQNERKDLNGKLGYAIF